MTTSEMATVMMAYEHGKKIEVKGKWEKETSWRLCTPLWNWVDCDYRVKPEPQYVPYDSIKEVYKDKWFKHKASGMSYRIILLDPNDNTVQLGYGWVSLQKLFEDYTYEDGTPCGKLVE